MRSWCFALAASLCTLLLPGLAGATDTATDGQTAAPTEAEAEAESPTEPRVRLLRPDRPKMRALELQGLGMAELLPRPAGGGDLAFAFGHPNFQVRVGVMALGVPPFRVGQGEVSNTLTTGTLDLCAAKRVQRHQIRMCLGGQLGAMFHRWKGLPTPGTRLTPWGAGTLKGDYQVMLTKRFGIIGGVGVVLPVLGPRFRGQTAAGSYSPVIFPGPMSGFLSLGTVMRW